MSQKRRRTSDVSGSDSASEKAKGAVVDHDVGEAQVRYGAEELQNPGEDHAVVEAIAQTIDGVAANLNRAAVALARIEEKLEEHAA